MEQLELMNGSYTWHFKNRFQKYTITYFAEQMEQFEQMKGSYTQHFKKTFKKIATFILLKKWNNWNK